MRSRKRAFYGKRVRIPAKSGMSGGVDAFEGRLPRVSENPVFLTLISSMWPWDRRCCGGGASSRFRADLVYARPGGIHHRVHAAAETRHRAIRRGRARLRNRWSISTKAANVLRPTRRLFGLRTGRGRLPDRVTSKRPSAPSDRPCLTDKGEAPSSGCSRASASMSSPWSNSSTVGRSKACRTTPGSSPTKIGAWQWKFSPSRASAALRSIVSRLDIWTR
jgi:hypothetical protein